MVTVRIGRIGRWYATTVGQGPVYVRKLSMGVYEWQLATGEEAGRVKWVDQFVVSRRADVSVRLVAWLSDTKMVEVGREGRWKWVVAAPPLTLWWNLAWLMWGRQPVLAVDFRRLGMMEGVDADRVRVVEMVGRMGG